MAEITRALIARVGVDLAKLVIQVHAVDAAGRRVVGKALKRDQFLAWCAQLPAGCVVAMEACSGAHHWARQLRAMGLNARLIAANFVSPYRMEGKSGKNDMNDAAAICEAASRPTMRFVPIKTAEQQGLMMLHRQREGFKEDRTACINRIRGALIEAGLAFGKSPKVLRAALPDVLEDASNALSGVGRLALRQAFELWRTRLAPAAISSGSSKVRRLRRGWTGVYAATALSTGSRNWRRRGRQDRPSSSSSGMPRSRATSSTRLLIERSTVDRPTPKGAPASR